MNKPAKLSDTRIKNAKPADKPIKLTDGGGLLLLVNPNGSRLWRYRYRLNDKENTFALGEYGSAPLGELPEAKALRVAGGILTLAEAREAHAKAKAIVKSGQHPSAVRAEARRVAQEARTTTFEGVPLNSYTTIAPASLKRVHEGHTEENHLPFLGFCASLCLASTSAMNSEMEIPSAGASLKIIFTLALLRPSSSNEM